MYYMSGLRGLGCSACNFTMSGLGAEGDPQEASAGGSSTSWVFGGILVAMAIGVFALDKKVKTHR